MAAIAAAAVPGDLSAQHGGSPVITVFESASSLNKWYIETRRIRAYSESLFRLIESAEFRNRVIKIVGFEDRTINTLIVHIRGGEFNFPWYNITDLQSNAQHADAISIARGYANLHRLAEIYYVVTLITKAGQEFQRWFAREPKTIKLIKLILSATDNDRYKLSKNMRHVLFRAATDLAIRPKGEDVQELEALMEQHPGFASEVSQASRGVYLLDP